MRFPVLMVKGFEADDVIGSMAKRAEKEGFDVFMVTPDKDYGQLISEHITQFKPGKSGSENELIDVAKVCEKYNISRKLRKNIIDFIIGKNMHDLRKLLSENEIDADKCKSCKACMKIGCPAISMVDNKAVVDTTLCTGCGLCQKMCKFDCISCKNR